MVPASEKGPPSADEYTWYSVAPGDAVHEVLTVVLVAPVIWKFDGIATPSLPIMVGGLTRGNVGEPAGMR